MHEKETLLRKVEELIGFIPAETRALLKILAHPDVISDTKEYFNAMDENTRCRIYESPWSCARESEARYENIKFGWTGAPMGFDESWCEPCRRKVLGG